MFTFLGAVLIIIGILGLIDVLAIGLVVEILLLVAGVALIAWEQGAFGPRGRSRT